MLKSVFFGHDGTLVNSEVEHFRFWEKAMKNHDVTLPEQQYRDLYCGVPGAKNAQMLVEEYDLPIPATQLLLEKETLTDQFLETGVFGLLPHVKETLAYFQRLKQQYPTKAPSTGVVSGAIHERIMSSLDGHHLTTHFDFICGGDEVEQNKPNPSIYLLVVEKSGAKTDQCIAIEDSVVGVKSALGAGLDVCAIRSEYTTGHDFSMATVVVNSMKEAKKWMMETYQLPRLT